MPSISMISVEFVLNLVLKLLFCYNCKVYADLLQYIWDISLLNLGYPLVSITFRRDKNRYIFSFYPVLQNFSSSSAYFLGV